MKITINEGEVWFGPSSQHGIKMPFDKDSSYSVNIETWATANQDNPLLLSNQGRIIYAPKGFTLKIEDGVIDVDSKFGDIEFHEGYESLRGAYLEAVRRYFNLSGTIPPEQFFRIPQYNTWIELIREQNQADILKYAHGIIDHGMPAGILMIDDGWNNYYGSFEFSLEEFPDPRAMCDELHAMGFKIMMWISPFISADSPEFRYLDEKKLLVRRPDGKAAIREWWNGFSAVLDMTNPECEKWLDSRLFALMDKYGIDGFKLDAGDAFYYFEDDVTFRPVSPAEHGELWNRYGLKFDYNEYRACFKCAGLPLVQRLHDKAHSWEEGVALLAPNTLAQGILGYAYVCPDMIGGGSFTDFLPGSTTFEPELLIRYCAACALMPMMQFSLAPWRVLDKEQFDMILGFIDLHEKFADRIIELAKEASVTGEPIVRYMEYEFPHKGFEHVTDCFMLGHDILVAPVYVKDAVKRTVTLPSGKWRFCDGRVFDGDCEVTVDAPLSLLPYFIKE